MNNLFELSRVVNLIKAAVMGVQQQQNAMTTISLPVKDAIVSGGEQIYLDHDRLPEMKQYLVNGRMQNGHLLNSDWIYTCWTEPDGGFFHLIGESGLFTMHPFVWNVNEDGNLAYEVVVEYSTGRMVTKSVVGNSPYTIMLDKGSRFFLRFDTLIGSSSSSTHIYNNTMFLLTRLSFAPDWHDNFGTN